MRSIELDEYMLDESAVKMTDIKENTAERAHPV